MFEDDIIDPPINNILSLLVLNPIVILPLVIKLPLKFISSLPI